LGSADDKPMRSGVLWIRYDVAGKRYRKKAGRKSYAINLHPSRNADAFRANH